MKRSERGQGTEGCITSAISSIRSQAASKSGETSTASVVRGFGTVLWARLAAGCSSSVDSCAAEMNDRWLQKIENAMLQCSCPNERNTCHSRRVATTSVIPGRRPGSCCQHWTVISQTGSVNFSSCGRSGSSRFMTILKTAAAGASSGNGGLPVKTLIRFYSR